MSRDEVKSATSSGDYSQVHDFYQRTFSSGVELNALLKKNPDQSDAKIDDPEILVELLNEIYDRLNDLVCIPRSFFFFWRHPSPILPFILPLFILFSLYSQFLSTQFLIDNPFLTWFFAVRLFVLHFLPFILSFLPFIYLMWCGDGVMLGSRDFFKWNDAGSSIFFINILLLLMMLMMLYQKPSFIGKSVLKGIISCLSAHTRFSNIFSSYFILYELLSHFLCDLLLFWPPTLSLDTSSLHFSCSFPHSFPWFSSRLLLGRECASH